MLRQRSGNGGPLQLGRRDAGCAAGFLLGGGGAESVSFPQRKNVQVIQVAYAGLGLGPNKRYIFLRLLRQVHSR